MEKNLEDFLETRPQRLCLKCGKCCKKVISREAYNDLVLRAENGDKNAEQFVDFFKPYESVQEAIEDSKEMVENALVHSDNDEMGYNDFAFYKCKHLNDDNLCEIYENRPEFCRLFPSNPWQEVPQGCGFEGWLFQKREEITAKIRRQKENLITLKLELKNAKNDEERVKIRDLIDKISATVEIFADYGSADW